MKLSLVIHNHQPVDNDPRIMEKIYRTSYLPFLQKLEEDSEVRVALHYTGPLLDWLEENHPETLATVGSMARANQVEIVGGAYYEPILAVIPDGDAIGQTKLMDQRIQSLFGVRRKGFWMAERVWEPHLPEVLRGCDVDYTFIDDTVFRLVGVPEEKCFSPFLVESRGCTTMVFPMLTRLRFIVPWKRPSETVQYLKGRHGIAIYGDDGEKFGSWPTTYEKVYERGWLDRFFRALKQNRDWLDVVLPSEFRCDREAEVVHLPAASYDEMLKWSLPPGGKKGARGFWRLFLTKYQESRRLYARMLGISQRANESGDAAAIRELWKAQCNDVYWHGVFGGLYLPILRKAAYTHLIRAQKSIEPFPEGARPRVRRDSVGTGAEVVVANGRIQAWISEGRGTLNELDHMPSAANLVDAVTRRREAYHAPFLRGAGVSTVHGATSGRGRLRLVYDLHPRLSFLDLLLDEHTTLHEVALQEFREAGRLVAGAFASRGGEGEENATVSLSEDAVLRGGTLGIQKEYVFPADSPSFTVGYSMKGGAATAARLAVCVNLGSLADRGFQKKHSRPSEARSKAVEVAYQDLNLKVRMSTTASGEIWRVPIQTLSQSERGPETIMQGLAVYFVTPVEEAKSFTVDFSVRQG